VSDPTQSAAMVAIYTQSSVRVSELVTSYCLCCFHDWRCREHRSQEVLLLVSDTTGREGTLQNMYLLQRWFPLMLAVSGAHILQQLHYVA
jgi:hypothetical protein